MREIKRFIQKTGAVILALSFPALSWAFSLGELADNFYAPTVFVTKFILFGCYAVGVALALTGIMQYKNHQQNPKLVPLSTPITLFIISAILFVLPFLSQQGGQSWSAAEKAKKEQKDTSYISPFGKKNNQTNPDKAFVPTPSPSTSPEAPVEEERHWGTQPQYQESQ